MLNRGFQISLRGSQFHKFTGDTNSGGWQIKTALFGMEKAENEHAYHASPHIDAVLWMEEILHHLGWSKVKTLYSLYK